MSSSFSTAEVAKHKDDGNGYWLIIENDVYDITSKSLFLCAWGLIAAHMQVCSNGG